LPSAIDIEGNLHIFNEEGKEIVLLSLDHNGSTITSYEYDGSDPNYPLITTGARDGTYLSIQLTFYLTNFTINL
jgi:hypothetical protein